MLESGDAGQRGRKEGLRRIGEESDQGLLNQDEKENWWKIETHPSYYTSIYIFFIIAIINLDLKYLFVLFDPIDIIFVFVDSEHRRRLMSWNGGRQEQRIAENIMIKWTRFVLIETIQSHHWEKAEESATLQIIVLQCGTITMPLCIKKGPIVPHHYRKPPLLHYRWLDGSCWGFAIWH